MAATPHDEGYAAAKYCCSTGIEIPNPYDRGTLQHKEWWEGWRAYFAKARTGQI